MPGMPYFLAAAYAVFLSGNLPSGRIYGAYARTTR